MKLKLDENLPASAAMRLRELGFDADTVVDEKLGGSDDATVWAAAQAEGRFFVTHDLDFSDIRRFAPGTHAGLLLLRLPESLQSTAADFLVACFATEAARTWTSCFVVATPSRLRVWRPLPDSETTDGDEKDDERH